MKLFWRMGLRSLLACCKSSELMMHAHNVPSAHRLLLLESDGRCNTRNSQLPPSHGVGVSRLVLSLTHGVQATRCIHTRRLSSCLAQMPVRFDHVAAQDQRQAAFSVCCGGGVLWIWRCFWARHLLRGKASKSSKISVVAANGGLTGDGGGA